MSSDFQPPTPPHSTSNIPHDPRWFSQNLAALKAELDDESEPNTQDILACGLEFLDSLRTDALDPKTIQPQLPNGRQWRRLYTDAILVKVLGSLDSEARAVAGDGRDRPSDSGIWLDLIRLLDLAIILAGAPGEGRLELIQMAIIYIQHNYLPSTPSADQPTTLLPRAPPPRPILDTQPVRSIEPPPPFSAFLSLAQRPFIMPGFADDWPAVKNWHSKAYLQEQTGRGRVIPVERGGDYRNEDWGVDIMPWDSFLSAIGWGNDTEAEGADSERLYLAQHSLFTQFPRLRVDIEVPDYVYTAPDVRSSVYSGPPGNDEQLVINAWCGGRGANSPAHTDPYYNIYVQIVGYKHIWLAPPEASPGMYAFNTDQGPDQNKQAKRDGMLGNTSSVDVFALSMSGSDSSAHSLFYEHSLPLAQSTILGPGDALVIPPGWWHAMRGAEGGSFSVSFWF